MDQETFQSELFSCCFYDEKEFIGTKESESESHGFEADFPVACWYLVILSDVRHVMITERSHTHCEQQMRDDKRPSWTKGPWVYRFRCFTHSLRCATVQAMLLQCEQFSWESGWLWLVRLIKHFLSAICMHTSSTFIRTTNMQHANVTFNSAPMCMLIARIIRDV